MIKVIASDMDGTLLGEDHKLAPRTAEAIRRACRAGIRFIVATGRDFKEAVQELDETGITCDYILLSGAEVRNPQQQIVNTLQIDMELCRKTYDMLKEYPVSVTFMTGQFDYSIGNPEKLEEDLLQSLQEYFHGMDPTEIMKTEMYRSIRKNSRRVRDFQELDEKNVPVYKIYVFGKEPEQLQKIEMRLEKNRRLAAASSAADNLEITDVRAQKGPVLKAYIESLGYTMDEVMVFGDSMNDYSMLSMDFGATIAMGNSGPEIIAAAKYLTKSNEEYGVAYAVEEMLKNIPAKQ